MTEKTKEQAENLAEMYEREVQSLINQYGTGVRPSWVSTDFAIANDRATKYRNLADSIKED